MTRYVSLPMRAHFSRHWRVWLIVAVVVVLANELVDRNFFDHLQHLDGDFVLTVLALACAFFGSYFVARRRAARTAA